MMLKALFVVVMPFIEDKVFLDRGTRKYLEALRFSMMCVTGNAY